MSVRIKILPETRMAKIRKYNDVYETVRRDIESGVIKPGANVDRVVEAVKETKPKTGTVKTETNKAELVEEEK